MVDIDSDLSPILANLSQNTLALRAAANASVSADRRPIKTRVLANVVNSQEFNELVGSLWRLYSIECDIDAKPRKSTKTP